MSTDCVGLHQIGVMVPPPDAAGIRAELLPFASSGLVYRLAALKAPLLSVSRHQLMPDAVRFDRTDGKRHTLRYLSIAQAACP